MKTHKHNFWRGLRLAPLLVLLFNITAAAQSNQWTWMSGSSSGNQAGNYGTLGTASATNVPGVRYGSVSWTDASGNLWLFGGYDNVSFVNDLWKYNISGGQWTWMSGSSSGNQAGSYGTLGTAAATNVPGARNGSVSWTDASGNLWLFGGYNPNLGYLNDLWKYNINSGQWTWMSGSSSGNQAGSYGTLGTASATNVPKAREYSISWADASGNLWLFGGLDYNFGLVNDLWKYNIVTGQWTWMSGSSSANQAGSYGTLGTASATNVPRARYASVSWTDASGNLWLFGGSDYNIGYFNDLWKFNTATAQWTWMGGSNSANQAGSYGTFGTASATNVPGARGSAVSWTDATGNLWLFGGVGFAASSSGRLNDLWKYNTATDQWAWMSGGSSSDQAGSYGTLGTASTTNVPGARGSDVSWTDASGNLWLFGGNGFAASSAGHLNDLWKYSAAINSITTGPIGSSPFCAGSNVTIPYTTSGTFTGTYVAELSDASGTFTTPVSLATVGSTSGSINATIPSTIATGSGYRIRIINSAPATNGSDNGSNLTINTLPDAIATPTSQTICNGTAITTIVLSGSVGGTTYNWMRSTPAGVTGMAASGSGNISGTFTNTTSSPVIVTFFITPTANGCPGTQITATVTVLPSLSVSTSVAPLYPLAGQEIQTIYLGNLGSATSETINAFATGGNSSYNYNWTKSLCNNFSSLNNSYANTTSSVTFAPTISDACIYNGDNVYEYTVTVTDGIGCTATSAKKLNVVNPYDPNGNVIVCHRIASRGAGLNQLLTVTPSQVAAHLQHGDQLANCSRFMGKQIVEEVPQEVAVYPNPTTGVFIVELSRITEKADITITDIQGRLVKHKTLGAKDPSTATFDLSNNAAGMYLIQLRDGDYSYNAKLILR